MSVDRRLRRGLHRSAEAITPGVAAAVQAVEGRARRRRRAVRVTRLAAAGVVIVVAAAAAPAVVDRLGGSPPGPAAVSRTALAGIWLNDDERTTLLLRLSPDGSFAIDGRGLLDVDPAAAGTYQLTGHTLTLAVTDGPDSADNGSGRSRLCPTGYSWTWQISMLADGRLRTLLADGGCGVPARTEWTWTRVSPWSPAAASIPADPAAGDGQPLQTALVVRGIWLREGSGQLLRVGSDGSYALDDGGRLGVDPDDIGSVEVTDGGTVVFTSRATSRVCAAGERTTWTDAQRYGDRVLFAVVSDDPCWNTGSAVTWIRLSP